MRRAKEAQFLGSGSGEKLPFHAGFFGRSSKLVDSSQEILRDFVGVDSDLTLHIVMPVSFEDTGLLNSVLHASFQRSFLFLGCHNCVVNTLVTLQKCRSKVAIDLMEFIIALQTLFNVLATFLKMFSDRRDNVVPASDFVGNRQLVQNRFVSVRIKIVVVEK